MIWIANSQGFVWAVALICLNSSSLPAVGVCVHLQRQSQPITGGSCQRTHPAAKDAIQLCWQAQWQALLRFQINRVRERERELELEREADKVHGRYANGIKSS